MKKLLLVFGVLIGLVGTSYALPANNSSLKTFYNTALVSSISNGNASFVTTSTETTNQFCSNVFAGSGGFYGTLLNCGSTAITGISLTGGTSGGYVVIYDANNNVNPANNSASISVGGISAPGEAGPAEVVFEVYQAANTGTYVDLSNAPISTTNGVIAYVTGTAGTVVYKGTGVATNI